MANPDPLPSNQQTQPSKRKRTSTTKPTTTTITLRNPQWSYIHLQHLSSTSTTTTSERTPLDPPTIHLHLRSALTQFAGLHGSAIAFDILKIAQHDVWLRVQAEDRVAFVAAIGGWVGKDGKEVWKVRGWSYWDAAAGAGGGGAVGIFD